MTRLRWVLLALLIVGFAVPRASAEGCGPLTDALVKGLGTPWRAVITSSGGGLSPSRVDLVAIADKLYAKDKSGQWKTHVRPADVGEARIRRDWANAVCTPSGTDSIDGEAADVVSNHAPGETFDTVTRYWISRASGLVLKTQAVRGPAVVTTTYGYDDVSPPAE